MAFVEDAKSAVVPVLSVSYERGSVSLSKIYQKSYKQCGSAKGSTIWESRPRRSALKSDHVACLIFIHPCLFAQNKIIFVHVRNFVIPLIFL